MLYDINVQEPYFSELGNLKTFEGRLNTGKFAQMQPGDFLCAYDPTNKAKSICLIVMSVVVYPSFASLLRDKIPHNVLPGITSVQDGVNVYRKFYTAEQEATHGVVAIQVRKFYD